MPLMQPRFITPYIAHSQGSWAWMAILHQVTMLLSIGLMHGRFESSCVELAKCSMIDSSRNTMLITNDLVNPNPGGPGFDPRHMYGVTNQDVFRWPAIEHGTERMLLGLFITTLHMPGIPLLLWGEEQAFYILDNTAGNYIFGRQPMSSATAWQNHGCYNLTSAQFYNFPVESALHGCHDDSVSGDHRDPSSPVRNIIKSMYQMRNNFPVLNDGWLLQQLSNQTHNVYYPGSNGTATETGVWSTLRGRFETQDLSGQGQGNQSVWLVYTNENHTVDFEFDCTNNNTKNTTALISPFDEGITVKNLFSPYDEVTLGASHTKLGINGSEKFNGCLNNITLSAWEFKAYVPIDKFVGPRAMITKFVPGHDARILSRVAPGKQESVPIELHFSLEMDCDAITNTLTINSTTEDLSTPRIDKGSVKCQNATNDAPHPFVGAITTTWTWSADLVNVSNGVHRVTVDNVTTSGNRSFTGVSRYVSRHRRYTIFWFSNISQ